MGAGGSIDYSAAAAASKNPRNNNKQAKGNKKGGANGSSVVPLLTLPGSLVSASSIMGGGVMDDDYEDQPSYAVQSTRSELGVGEQDMMSMVVNMSNMHHQQPPPLSSHRQEHLPGLTGNSAGGVASYDNNGEGKKKKSKIPKVPVINGATNSSNVMPAIVNNKQGQDNMKMPSINSATSTAHHVPSSSSANSYDGDGGMEVRQDESGNGDSAGPFDDWGWANEHKQGKVVMAEDDQGVEYSEDEDFVVSSGNNNGKAPDSQQQQRRKKKKKSNRQARNSNDDGYGNNRGAVSGSSTLPPIDMKHSITPRGHQNFSLPPI